MNREPTPRRAAREPASAIRLSHPLDVRCQCDDARGGVTGGRLAEAADPEPNGPSRRGDRRLITSSGTAVIHATHELGPLARIRSHVPVHRGSHGGPPSCCWPAVTPDHRHPYHELGADYFDRRLDPERETRRLIAKPEALGHQVTLDAAV
jgi:hypothetical protein